MPHIDSYPFTLEQRTDGKLKDPFAFSFSGSRLIPYAARRGPKGEIHRPSNPAAFRRLNESGSSAPNPFP